jgi:hypothetical protein
MNTNSRQILAVVFLVSMSLPALAGSTAVREGRSPSNYVGTGTTSPNYNLGKINPMAGCCGGYTGGGGGSSVPTSSADFVFAPGTGNVPPAVPYPRYEPANQWPAANPGPDPFDNPAQDLRTREEMERDLLEMSTPVLD